MLTIDDTVIAQPPLNIFFSRPKSRKAHSAQNSEAVFRNVRNGVANRHSAYDKGVKAAQTKVRANLL